MVGAAPHRPREHHARRGHAGGDGGLAAMADGAVAGGGRHRGRTLARACRGGGGGYRIGGTLSLPRAHQFPPALRPRGSGSAASRVGGGPLGLWLTAALPSAAALLAMATAGWKNTAAGVATALTGPAVWWWRARRG